MFVLLLVLAQSPIPAQPVNAHQQGVEQRGDHAMTFSHEKTIHHFRLAKDGGAIEVVVIDPSDMASRDAIRMHLGHVVTMFSAGDFSAPMFVHDQLPPGVPTMQRLKEKIHYKIDETGRGATVRISTADMDAIAAIHEFLRFQIEDHKTGDSESVQP